jgi:hypothetical protein
VELKDVPAEITQVMNGFQGGQYLLVQDGDRGSREPPRVGDRSGRRVTQFFLSHRNIIAC